MSYALVGSLGTVAAGGSPAFGQATTAGNLLVAWGAGPAGASLSTGSGWAIAVVNASGTAGIWYKQNCGSGETAPTFSGLNASQLGEFSGGATASVLDKTAENSGAATPVAATAASADLLGGELVLACQCDGLSKSGTITSSHTYNNGASATGNANNDSTSTTPHYRFSYGITTGNSSADSVSFADNSMNLVSLRGIIASFKLASVAKVPRNPVVNHSATTLLAKAWSPETSWRKGRAGIFVPAGLRWG